MKQIYLGGGMLSKGDQRLREGEKTKLTKLGYKVYAPQDDKDINDKTNANQDKLAERIVKNDTQGILKSDILIFDYLPHNQGTIAEMGFAQCMLRVMKSMGGKVPKVYVQCTDIRQGTGHIPKEQDRMEFSINQYVYGVILEITEGRGVQKFHEILEDLS